MELLGLHHVSMITGDAQGVVDFYADVLGLRLVKTTVNFDAPEAYHLYFGDEQGAPGSLLTWFEFAGAAAGRAGDGMIHTLQLAVATAEALDFWAVRLAGADRPVERVERGLRTSDPDGLALELVVAPEGPALRAEHPDVPAAHALLGLAGARAYGAIDEAPDPLLVDVLGFRADPARPGDLRLVGGRRPFAWGYDPAPGRGRPGAGTVHHIAWASPDADHERWQAAVREAGHAVTEVRDRDYFRAIYFREPHGVLFEIATLSPGFAVDEDPDRLGEALCLPPRHEHLRPALERTLRPLVNPRAVRRADGAGAA